MNDPIIAEAENWLKRCTRLESHQRASLAALVPTLIDALTTTSARLVGIGGPPGSGKSTLAWLLRDVLHSLGVASAVLSLDDYYLTRAERASMASRVHPLFATRGVPGTHDLGLLMHDLECLLNGELDDLVLPRFDKAGDERLTAPNTWQGGLPAVVFVEGWCIGCPPMEIGDCEEPMNATERNEDTDGLWRQQVREHLQRHETALQARLDLRWFMAPPDWNSVIRWRWQQEKELGERKRLESIGEVRSFLDTYERLCRHMLSSCNAWADVIIDLDENHCAKLRIPT